MGDRANIVVTEDGGETGVWLYSHWGGTELWSDLQIALNNNWRWTDGSYLTRIIFCQMVKEDIEGENGYGISTFRTGDEHPVLVVDVMAQKVHIYQDEKTCLGEARDEPDKTYSFEEFCALTEDPRASVSGC